MTRFVKNSDCQLIEIDRGVSVKFYISDRSIEVPWHSVESIVTLKRK